MAIASNFLETNVFLFSAPLRKALISVRAMTIPLGSTITLLFSVIYIYDIFMMYINDWIYFYSNNIYHS